MASEQLPATSLMQLPESSHTFELDMPLREARDNFERVYFEYHLAREGGSMTRVAEKTGLERTHLYRKLKQLGVDIARGSKRGFSAAVAPAPAIAIAIAAVPAPVAFTPPASFAPPTPSVPPTPRVRASDEPAALPAQGTPPNS